VGWLRVCRLIFLLVCRSVRLRCVYRLLNELECDFNRMLQTPHTTPNLPFRENLRLGSFGSVAGIVGVLCE
jgi:hypothetical protein